MRHIMNPPGISTPALERSEGCKHHPSQDMRAVMRNVSQERDPQTYAVIGAAMAVHKELGNGFLERVYHEALAIELTERAIPYRCEVEVNVHYKGRLLTCTYRADLICFPHAPVLVELKACDQLTHAHRAQLIHYMKAPGIQRALLINFGGPVLQFERMVLGWKG
jgi:GxxExxY protein